MGTLSVCTLLYTQTLNNAGGCHEYQVDCTGGAQTITLDTAVGYDGFHIYLKRQDSNAGVSATITPKVGEKIDRSASNRTMGLNATLHIMAYGGNWWII